MTRKEPDPEKLAALLDARLSSSEREALLVRLATSAEERELLADTAFAMGEAAREGSPELGAATARARRRWWRHPGWLALAAGVAGIAAVSLIRSSTTADNADPVAIIARLSTPERGLPPGWEGQPWPTTRSAVDSIAPRALAVRAGARMVDLALALRSNDVRAVEIATDLRNFARLGTASAVAVSQYDSLLAALTPAFDGSRLTPLSERAARSLSGVLGEEDVTLGAWLEGARLAAARNDAAYFREAPPMTGLDAEERTAVDRIRALATSDPATWSDVGGVAAEVLGRRGR